MYTWNQIGIKEITNLYLYGEINKPQDLATSSLIRPPGDPKKGSIFIEMDAVSFMMSGPGRFANASEIPVVKAFFDGPLFAATGQRQTFTLEQATAKVGTKSANISIAQSSYQDNTNDHSSRTYIYQSSSFTLAQGTVFVIEADGTKHIQNLAVLPYDDNFDFVSDSSLSTFGNYYLRPRIDPTGLGRRVDINFTQESKNSVPRVDYYGNNFVTDVSRQQQTYTPAAGAAKLATEMPQVVSDLWTQGSTQLLDSQGRVVLHGSNGADILSPARIDANSAYEPLRTGGAQI